MDFRLVQKSVTLNDLERLIGRYVALFHRIRYSFRGPMTSKWLKINLYGLRQKNVAKKNLIFSDRLSFLATSADVIENECILTEPR